MRHCRPLRPFVTLPPVLLPLAALRVAAAVIAPVALQLIAGRAGA